MGYRLHDTVNVHGPYETNTSPAPTDARCCRLSTILMARSLGRRPVRAVLGIDTSAAARGLSTQDLRLLARRPRNHYYSRAQGFCLYSDSG
ncbi:hypothetical protein POSPLADRAFT_1067997 [Postia placenta MAD-698-R-SB12]|uniref:Uncharacterized protein n=1 Tax=Postia placenta MAD-698-R-SB12 TaxID=670580 RepID=A0A1X6MKV4_9APHY|nr:hypothetical protein POSPLADRAFT_1067997 [Postia placenta MAD-698-R-SB12]OSX57005.1 hypothetical protein POSPLADRAFT_1067997 [Postia placenta MAD-698-R-SB12]